jgi:SAM-dependent methyltransferase
LGIFVNPFYFTQRELYREMVQVAPKLSGQLLDVGCGSKPYRDLFVNVDHYTGLEFDTPESRAANYADFFYDGNHFPFDDASYDVVLTNQVFEHVFNPDEFLNEILRILKPEGKLLLSVPFVWDEHLQPLDFARYSSFGLRSLLERHGFVVVDLRKMNADVRVIFQMINVYLYKILLTPSGKINLLLCAIFMAPFTLLGIILSKVLPANPDLFLSQIVLARKKTE